LASECNHLSDAEYYRNQILREISAGIAKIQNPALGEHTIRDLNDEINRKLREKYHWNRRIVELGGVDHNAMERQRQIEEGDTQSVAGLGGYRYFGAAKDLPGVAELLEKHRSKVETMKDKKYIDRKVTPAYFGWRDEEDGVLLELEETAFKRQRKEQHNVVDLDRLLEEDYFCNVPSQEEMAQILLDEKKQTLLARFSL
jgi:pre-mRNA-splicing factor ISY1